MVVYFAKIHKNKNNQYEVSFPDLDPYAATYGNSIDEVLKNAHDALMGYLLTAEDYDETVNKPTKDVFKLNKNLKENEFITPIEVDLKLARIKEQNKLVKKTLTIPEYLNVQGKEANINFSALLTEALKHKLNA